MHVVRFLLFLVLGGSAFAAAPSTVTGFVFWELTAVTGPGVNRGNSLRILRLEPEGRYAGLYQETRRFNDGMQPRTSILPDGVWLYRKLNETTAELTLDGATQVLTFESDTNGRIQASDVFFTRIMFTLAPPETTAQLSNCSTRTYVRAGGSAAMGFAVSEGTRRVLIRAVGPALQGFGVTEVLRTPRLKLIRTGTNETLATNEGWPESLREASVRAGAFPLPANSRDAALFLSLTPGVYIAEVTSTNAADSGEVLVELYTLP